MLRIRDAAKMKGKMKGSKTLGGVSVKAKRGNNERDQKNVKSRREERNVREMEDGTRCTRTRRSEESVESKSDVYGENYKV